MQFSDLFHIICLAISGATASNTCTHVLTQHTVQWPQTAEWFQFNPQPRICIKSPFYIHRYMKYYRIVHCKYNVLVFNLEWEGGQRRVQDTEAPSHTGKDEKSQCCVLEIIQIQTVLIAYKLKTPSYNLYPSSTPLTLLLPPPPIPDHSSIDHYCISASL